MPSRWFVPFGRVDPQRVRSDYLHAAISRWFDADQTAHAKNDKPYAVSPLTDAPGVPGRSLGVEVATLTAAAENSLMQNTKEGSTIRLGNQIRPVAPPQLMHRESWDQLLSGPISAQSALQFVTPVTFRTGNRSTPLPDAGTILAGLERSWQFSGIPLEDFQALKDAAWVSDLDLHSVVVKVPIRGKDGQVRELITSGSLGSLTLRCDEPCLQPTLAALVGLAAYSGVGSMTLRGLGVTRVSSGPHAARNLSPEI